MRYWIPSLICFALVIAIAVFIFGCVDIPLEVDADDVEGRPELSIRDVKQTLRSLYSIPEDVLDFVPWYEHYHLYAQSEIEEHFNSWFVRYIEEQFEWSDHRSCVWKGTALWLYLTAQMPGLPAFTASIYPKGVLFADGHVFVGVLVQPYSSANRKFLLLDYRYPIWDDRAIQEFDSNTMRIGDIKLMAPGRVKISPETEKG